MKTKMGIQMDPTSLFVLRKDVCCKKRASMPSQYQQGTLLTSTYRASTYSNSSQETLLFRAFCCFCTPSFRPSVSSGSRFSFECRTSSSKSLNLWVKASIFSSNFCRLSRKDSWPRTSFSATLQRGHWLEICWGPKDTSNWLLGALRHHPKNDGWYVGSFRQNLLVPWQEPVNICDKQLSCNRLIWASFSSRAVWR